MTIVMSPLIDPTQYLAGTLVLVLIPALLGGAIGFVLSRNLKGLAAGAGAGLLVGFALSVLG